MSVRFSASSAARLMACPASAHLEKAIPNWVEPVVDRSKGQKAVGTKRHKILEPIMEMSAKDIQHMATMLQYVADVRSRRRFKVLIEQTVKATWLVQQPDTTADLVLYTQDEIHILDAKWGKIRVEAVDNVQLLYYAVCYAPLAPKAKGVWLHIMQPYADNYESWFVDTNVLRQFMDQAIQAEAKILAGDITFGPSDNCTFCPANPHARTEKGKPLCPAMMQILYPPIVHDDEILNL